MIFNRNYLRGAVKIRISGTMPERFINLCITEQILLWGITKTDKDLVAWIGLHDFFQIRPLVLASRTKVKVLAHRGLPFMAKRIKKRKVLMFGCVLFLALLYTLTSYVWFVEVKGSKNVPEQTIRDVAEQYGLKPGAGKERINLKAIEREIMLNVPEVAWVGIDFTGTRAVIEIVEKTMPKQENKAPAHIVAAKDGVITEIIALAGQAAVKNGDTVKKGDVLIKGLAPEPAPAATDSQPPIINAPRELVRAKGIIKARVWYESYAETELTQTTMTRTGNMQMCMKMKIGDTEIAFNDVPEPPFQEYETEIIGKQLPLWRNSEFPVESTIKIYHEINSNLIEKPFEQARDEAHAKAVQAVQDIIPEAAQILSRNYEVIKTPEDNIVRVKVNVETIEDIGQTINISQ
ncbi:sporulation protein YqfD [Sporomusa acidovorans]|uniref:Stage IV sporulation protein YqfD n=1 Tax=Sporomusa acidovorans (strain ATCC 49682 / DSM 3132 / Mol) TaxID=1123286 RepID=A0ABZ3J530_SPOA4|nr:sporulation protein YqfD [Sporomusa acidovorans]OZC23125.1 putative stage IV sporulation protein YqfD [Sporomusa acidovorans DSM 3132]SDF06157.1 similar to stage IV sporulation protein [Sporomusa acidovorans]